MHRCRHRYCYVGGAGHDDRSAETETEQQQLVGVTPLPSRVMSHVSCRLRAAHVNEITQSITLRSGRCGMVVLWG